MTKTMKKANLVIYIFVVIIIFVAYYSYVSYHEAIHKRIFHGDGCTNIKTHVGIFGGYAMCLDDDYKMSKEANNLHVYNEIISYNVNILLVVIICCLAIILVFIDYYVWLITNKGGR